jgi:hypothetical protein
MLYKQIQQLILTILTILTVAAIRRNSLLNRVTRLDVVGKVILLTTIF